VGGGGGAPGPPGTGGGSALTAGRVAGAAEAAGLAGCGGFWRCLRGFQIIELLLQVSDLCLVIFLDISNFALELFDLIIHRRCRLCQGRAWQTGTCQYRERLAENAQAKCISRIVHSPPPPKKLSGPVVRHSFSKHCTPRGGRRSLSDIGSRSHAFPRLLAATAVEGATIRSPTGNWS